MGTALDQALRIDRRRDSIVRTAQMLLHRLDRYIPEACRREVLDAIFVALNDAKVEVVSVNEMQRLREIERQVSTAGAVIWGHK